MDIGVISVRYARALLKVAQRLKLEDKVYREMQTLARVISGTRTEIYDRQSLCSPRIKSRVLLITLVAMMSEYLTQNLFKLVLSEDRENTLQFMANSYITLYRKQKNITRGNLSPPLPSPSTEQKMKQMVESKLMELWSFRPKINLIIIGGFILEYDTYRMDASVTRLKAQQYPRTDTA
jgi:F-type H+-transporting ATPase subunit delta